VVVTFTDSTVVQGLIADVQRPNIPVQSPLQIPSQLVIRVSHMSGRPYPFMGYVTCLHVYLSWQRWLGLTSVTWCYLLFANNDQRLIGFCCV